MQYRLNRSLTGLIFRQFLEYWWMYVLAFICLYVTHYCQSYLPLLAKDLADAISHDQEFMSKDKLVYFAIGIVIFRTSSRLFFFTPARYLERDMRFELVKRLEDATPFRYQHWSSGQIFTTLFSDMQQMRALIGFALLQLGNVVVAIAVLFPKLYQFNPQLVLAYTPMVIGVILLGLITMLHQGYFRKIQDKQGEVQNFLVETYQGKKSIKNYHAESSFIGVFTDLCKEELSYFFKTSRAIGSAMPLVPLAVGVSFFWGAIIIKQQDLGASALILFSGFIFLLLEPLIFMSWIGTVYTRSVGSWNRIKELLHSLDNPNEQELELLEYNQLGSKLGATDHVQFKIPFWGPNGVVDIQIDEFKWTVFVGRTGSGKTTILRAIAETLQSNGISVSFVAQEPYIYNDSIIKNIFLGKEPSVTEKQRALHYLKMFGLDLLVAENEDVFDLEVGENGKRLSGGQAKRLCLIRSLMSGSAYLIWDDPFSSVDFILEKQIVLSLREEEIVKKKTVIVSSHRISTVRFCDNLYFIEPYKGIQESGSVLDLLMENSKTHEYFQKQLV